MNVQSLLISSLLLLAACRSDRANDEADPKQAGARALSPDQYRQRQQVIADSVLAAARPVEKIVEQLGTGYAVGPDALRDTITTLAQHASCFGNGRNTDPYLAGVVNIVARMTATGTDLVRVQTINTRWTSAAGDLVNACLNSEMKKWKLDARYGTPAGYIVQVRFKSDTTR
jgi:hypothetical protein